MAAADRCCQPAPCTAVRAATFGSKPCVARTSVSVAVRGSPSVAYRSSSAMVPCGNPPSFLGKQAPQAT